MSRASRNVVVVSISLAAAWLGLFCSWLSWFSCEIDSCTLFGRCLFWVYLEIYLRTKNETSGYQGVEIFQMYGVMIVKLV
jgi:hypothetical protein